MARYASISLLEIQSVLVMPMNFSSSCMLGSGRCYGYLSHSSSRVGNGGVSCSIAPFFPFGGREETVVPNISVRHPFCDKDQEMRLAVPTSPSHGKNMEV